MPITVSPRRATQTLRPHPAVLVPTDHHRARAERDDSPVNAASDRAVARWLMTCAVAVAVAVAIGGITRLTESGLSITEWRPVSGVLPPLTAADWADAYQRYLAIPEAQTVHRGITLHEFKGLFWWEWVHRMLARGVGLVLAVPFFVLLMRRQIRPGMRLRLANLPLLAAMQGGMGWYMVQSGLSDRTSVSPYRLVAHLSIALVIFAVAVWTAVELRVSSDRAALPGLKLAASRRNAVVVASLLSVLAFITMLSGGFVAGLDAGKIFNTFPLMEGRLVPMGYGAIDGWRNALENPIAAQLHHRILAMLTALLLWAAAAAAFRGAWPRGGRRWLGTAAGIAALQIALGIATILLAVPLTVAVLHQLGALALLGSLLAAAVSARDPGQGRSETIAEGTERSVR